VEQLQEKQRIASTGGMMTRMSLVITIENQMLAVNLFHMRGGKVLDRREFFWEDLPEFGEAHPERMRLARARTRGTALVETNFIPEFCFLPLVDAGLYRATLCSAEYLCSGGF
jgi:excinuclease UvrABC nuclease subunit